MTGAENTDTILYRFEHDDWAEGNVFRTEGGGLGINIGGNVIVKQPSDWFRLACPQGLVGRKRPQPLMKRLLCFLGFHDHYGVIQQGQRNGRLQWQCKGCWRLYSD